MAISNHPFVNIPGAGYGMQNLPKQAQHVFKQDALDAVAARSGTAVHPAPDVLMMQVKLAIQKAAEQFATNKQPLVVIADHIMDNADAFTAEQYAELAALICQPYDEKAQAKATELFTRINMGENVETREQQAARLRYEETTKYPNQAQQYKNSIQGWGPQNVINGIGGLTPEEQRQYYEEYQKQKIAVEQQDQKFLNKLANKVRNF